AGEAHDRDLSIEDTEQSEATTGLSTQELEPAETDADARVDDTGTSPSTTVNASSETERDEEEPEAESAEPERVEIETLADRVGETVRIEGEIVTARQTSGPTVFDIRDETGSVECAAFEEAGVRAYPDVEEGDAVRLDGEVERRRGDLQIETDAIIVLDGDDRDAVRARLANAVERRAAPEPVAPLAGDETVAKIASDVREAATAIRRAVIEGRPIIVRHAADVDGYVAGAALERATLPLIEDEHPDADAVYHYFDRRPLEGTVYDLDDATGDVTTMLSNAERHDEQYPLFVFAAAGGTSESLDGFDLLSVYGAPTVVIEGATVDDVVQETVETVVTSPEGDNLTASTLAANVAAHVNAAVRADLGHLPAVSVWDDVSGDYLDLAADAGYEPADVRKLREAVALEAFYQSYEDKRELITDLLFSQSDAERSLASHVSEQYRTRMDDAIATAQANLETTDIGGIRIAILDTDAYTHRYEFPPTDLLLDVLWRNLDEVDALLGLDEDEAYLRPALELDVRAIVEEANANAPGAGLDAAGAREGHVAFLAGEREAVRDALAAAIAGERSSLAAA
ncbi:MAG: OB-fold nucleic acid binding domain-containing protein, partial [Salinirussus sp.]